MLGLAVALIYGLLAGFTVPVQRALFMLACFAVAALSGRPVNPADRLLFAALLVLLANPLAVVGVGFWLSFAAVALLLWFSL